MIQSQVPLVEAAKPAVAATATGAEQQLTATPTYYPPPPSVDDRLKQLLAKAEALRTTLAQQPLPNASVPYVSL